MSTALATLSRAATQLATIRDIPELLDIADKAEAIRRYTKAAGDGLTTVNEAARIKGMAERCAGKLVKEMQDSGRLCTQKTGRPSMSDSASDILTFEDVGITHQQSSRFQREAMLSDEDFDRLCNECNTEGRELTQSLIIKTATGAHVGHNSGDNEWYTPEEYIEAAKLVMGGIDLDPASSEAANEKIGATEYFTEEQDGLKEVWRGRVWMNPPYAQPLMGKFAEHLAIAIETGSVTQACILVNNATETKWFQRMASVSVAACFPSGRVKFWSPDKESATPLQGQAFLYAGKRTAKFAKHFGKFGLVLERTKRNCG